MVDNIFDDKVTGLGQRRTANVTGAGKQYLHLLKKKAKLGKRAIQSC